MGLATALDIVRNGGYASILDINPPPSDSTIVQAHRGNLLYTHTDVSSTTSLEHAVKETVDWTRRISAPLFGLVCCAAIGSATPILPEQEKDANANANADISEKRPKFYDMVEFDSIISINLRGTFDLIRLVVPHLSISPPNGADGERGVIVLVSSLSAYEGKAGQAAYAASKGAINSMVLPLARELGPKAGIRVIGIAPGKFDTGITYSKPKEGTTAQKGNLYPARMGRADEFARLVREIAENSMLNGSVIRLDGSLRLAGESET